MARFAAAATFIIFVLVCKTKSSMADFMYCYIRCTGIKRKSGHAAAGSAVLRAVYHYQHHMALRHVFIGDPVGQAITNGKRPRYPKITEGGIKEVSAWVTVPPGQFIVVSAPLSVELTFILWILIRLFTSSNVLLQGWPSLNYLRASQIAEARFHGTLQRG
jgi:hypothetical protein